MEALRKTEAQIAMMRRAGLIVWEAHQAAAALIAPGVTTAMLDGAVEQVIAGHGAIPLFKGVPGAVPFPAATCISINCEVVHGIPGPRRLCHGDVVTIDIGVRLDGWCADAAVTHPVGTVEPRVRDLLVVTEEALRLAIRSIGGKSHWSQVAAGIAELIESAGFQVVEDLFGHGIGQELWERPQVPNRVGADDFELVPGLVLAVEPLATLGAKEIRLLPDHWTVVTADGSVAAHFEHTVAITPEGAQVLTAGPDHQGWAL
ncbi:MAG: type I methionyl aminopeptidase [Acidobacteriota bacterium]|nr:type I methionyl aminopeptidase [Acidobacteriota bacterium]